MITFEKIENRNVDEVEDMMNLIMERFPELFSTGKFDFDLFRRLVNSDIKDTSQYSFLWNGKADSLKVARSNSIATLRPDKLSSKFWDRTNNLYIEGDNLEVLKLIQKTYFNRIDVIYIDPPYNTGNDFIYRDSFSNSIDNYKILTQQTFRANPDTNGRFHTDWLNLIYPRIVLAHKLLKDNGVIFISIDENEYENLLKISKEIFGEPNYLGTIIWENRTTPNDSGANFGVVHEYIVVLAKNKNQAKFKGIGKDFALYSNPDNDENGPWIKDNPSAASGNPLKDRFDIVNPYTGQVYNPPKGRYWAFAQRRVEEWTASGKLVFPKTLNTNFTLKKYRSELKSESKPFPSLISGILTSAGTKELKEIFHEINDSFKYPKSTNLITKLIEQVLPKDGIVLDFFSGSSTTAHAVIQLNAEDGGNRKFIMVQLPEKTDEKSEAYKAGYENICEIGKERIRRAGDKIRNELVEKQKNQGMLEDSIDPNKLDIGFKVFKLDTSNFSTFDSSSKDLDNIFNQEVFVSERSSHDILYEILLKYGVFDKPVDVLNINGKEVFSVAMNQTIVFINNSITEEDIVQIASLKPREVIFDERGFESDNDKINALKRLETAGVEKVATI